MQYEAGLVFAAGGFLLRDGELSTLELPGLGVEPARP